MRYVVGVDGGGTKTDIVLCFENGALCDRIIVGGSNHQISGMEKTGDVLLSGIRILLERNGLRQTDLAAACFGLAGADLPEDVEALTRLLDPLRADVPCRVVNDVWLPLAAMAPTGAGAISICGTGHNTAVRCADGTQLQVAALDYALGNWGGGKVITEQAMHYAMRDMEHTGPHTMLTQRLPAVYGKPDMKELQRHLYLTGERDLYNPPVPKLISELAMEGDEVCIRILTMNGRIQAEMTAGLICHAGLCQSDIRVVLAGSLYQREESGCMVEGYRTELLRTCPNARILLLDCPPVVGAALLALQHGGLLSDGSKALLMNDLKEKVVA